MWNEEQDHDSGSEAGADDSEEKFLPCYFVLAIDCHPSMFQPDGEGALPFRTCLQACYELADGLVLESKWSPFAVVLARQEVGFVSFSDPIVETRKTLEAKLGLSDDQLRAEFARDHKLEYPNFFLRCKKVFNDQTGRFFQRSLVFITNDPDPVAGNKTEKHQSIAEVKTFSASDIRFEVVTMREDFDYDSFYKELYSAMGWPLVEEICTDAEGLLDKFTTMVNTKLKKQRMQFYPFRGDTERLIDVMSFRPIRGPPSIMLNKMVRRDGKKIKICRELGDNFEPFYKIKRTKRREGLEPVFSSAERDSLYDSSLKLGLHLMFVSQRITKVGVCIGKLRLLQENPAKPSEYFSKFWQCCAEADRVLVCLLKKKHLDERRFVELLPLMVDGKPTFMMQTIPFATEIMLPQRVEQPSQDDNPEYRRFMERLVDRLSFDFDLDMIPDTFQRRKLAYIKAKLLGSDVMQEEDNVTFDRERLDEVLGDLPQQYEDLFFFGELPNKRKASTAGGQNKRGRGSTRRN